MGRGAELANGKHAAPRFPLPRLGMAEIPGSVSVCVWSTHEAPLLCAGGLQYVGALLPGYPEILGAPYPLFPTPAVAGIRPHIAKGMG